MQDYKGKRGFSFFVLNTFQASVPFLFDVPIFKTGIKLVENFILPFS